MSLTTILAHGRAAAANRMFDTCTIRRTTGVTTDAKGAVMPTTVVVYSGPCRIKLGGPGSATDGGEVTVSLLSPEVHIPVVGSEAVLKGDTLTVDSALNDTALVGRTFQVIGKDVKSESTVRRLSCEDVE